MKPLIFYLSVKADGNYQSGNFLLMGSIHVFVFQVRLSVFMTYVRAVGLKSSLAIVVLYGLYQAFNIGSSVWLTHWTADLNLQVSKEVSNLSAQN
jgi:hypothetical protein